MGISYSGKVLKATVSAQLYMGHLYHLCPFSGQGHGWVEYNRQWMGEESYEILPSGQDVITAHRNSTIAIVVT